MREVNSFGSFGLFLSFVCFTDRRMAQKNCGVDAVKLMLKVCAVLKLQMQIGDTCSASMDNCEVKNLDH